MENYDERNQNYKTITNYHLLSLFFRIFITRHRPEENNRFQNTYCFIETGKKYCQTGKIDKHS